MADTLVERVTGQDHAEDVPIQVNLVMTDVSLLAGDPEPATIPGYGPIPAAIARHFAARGTALTWLRRLYTRPSDGRLVSLESRARLFPQGLAEFIELRDHPFWVGTQAHPEFKSRPHRAHPLFAGLIGAALERQRANRLIEVERPKVLADSD